MNLKEAALQYYNYGLSVIPIGENKIPQGRWKEAQFTLIEPNGNFEKAKGIGIVCGEVSGGLFCIDFDTKNDLSKPDSWDRFKAALTKEQRDLIKLCIVESTPSNGRHLIYRVDGIIGGNEKFAARYTTEQERVVNPKSKVLCTVESRGVGGYYQVAPTKGYEILNGSFENIPVLTQEQHDDFVNICKSLDQTNMWDIKPEEKKLAQQPKRLGVSVFEAYNLNADIPSLLEQYDWKYVETHGSNMRFLRPNGSGRTSADWHIDMRLLHVFTSSTEFHPSKSYNPVQIYTILKYGSSSKENYAAAAKDFKEMGYGETFDPIEIQSQLRIDELDLNHLADMDEADSVLDDIRSGDFAMGVGIGMDSLDDKWVYKVGQFNVINGHANVGKTTFLIWWFVMLSKKYEYNWLICSTENDTWEFLKMIIEFYTGKIITNIPKDEYESAKEWAKQHFTIFSNERTYTYKEVLSIAQNEMKAKPYAGLLIDPFSGLEYIVDELKTFGAYTYHYRSANSYRMFCKKTLISIYLIIHPPTDATRRVKDGKIEAPNAADAEYGNMWFNRCWNYLTAHRHTNGMDWNIMYIYVRKIKNLFSGGGITIEPVKLKMIEGGRGYVDEFERMPKTFSNYYEKKDDDIAPF